MLVGEDMRDDCRGRDVTDARVSPRFFKADAFFTSSDRYRMKVPKVFQGSQKTS